MMIYLPPGLQLLHNRPGQGRAVAAAAAAAIAAAPQGQKEGAEVRWGREAVV